MGRNFSREDKFRRATEPQIPEDYLADELDETVKDYLRANGIENATVRDVRECKQRSQVSNWHRKG